MVTKEEGLGRIEERETRIKGHHNSQSQYKLVTGMVVQHGKENDSVTSFYFDRQ